MRVDWLITLPTPVFLVLPLTASTRMGKRNPTPDQLQQLAHVDRLEEARCHAERRDLMLHFLGARRDDDWNRVFHLAGPESRPRAEASDRAGRAPVVRGSAADRLPPDHRRRRGAGRPPPAGSASAWCGSRPARWVRSSGGSARNVPPSVLYQPGPMQSRRAGDWREEMDEPNARGPPHWAGATGPRPCSE